MTDYQTLLDQCHKPFKWHEHEFLQNKFIYVRIQSTVQRLNSLGVPWSFDQGPVAYTEEIVITEARDGSEKKTKWFTAATEGQLMIENMGSRGAPGAARGTDKDNTGKSAHSFALRKAASLFGVSHYLMVNPDAESNFVRFMETADLTDLTTLKKAVKLCSDIDGLTAKEWLAKYVDTTDINPLSLGMALINAGRI